MSTATPPAPPKEKLPDYITVVGHSNLFYWWPVWALGFLMAALTTMDGYRMAIVPSGTVVEHKDGRDALVLPADRQLPAQNVNAPADPGAEPTSPTLLVARTNTYGVIFLASVVLCAVVSNITFRGLVSIIVVAVLIVGGLALALLNLWDPLLRFVGGIDVRLNAGGYLFLSVPLFAAWCFTTFFYDRQHYVVFDEGQVRYVRDIGDGETVMDVNGIVVEKKRDDIFRHWILGLGTGDMRIKTGGSNSQTFEIENVIGISRRLKQVHQMLQTREVSAVVQS